MAKVDARALVARLNARAFAVRDRLILAPVLPGGRVRTRLDGLIHEFRVRSAFSGWGRFRPLDEREAALEAEAQPWERAVYLDLFPLLRVILLWPDPRRPSTWWALPANESDARQRFGLNGDSLAVHLCDPLDGADRFEQVLARVDGRALWYEGPDPRADPAHAAWLRDAASTDTLPDRYPAGMSGPARLALWHGAVDAATRAVRDEVPPADLAGLEYPQWPDHAPPAPAGNRALEQRLRRALAKADAALHGFSEAPGRPGEPGMLVVEWSERGRRRRYRSLLARDLTVVSSGICLSGCDHVFDLTSLVGVMADI
jgi:hypothetical protein